MACSHVWIDPTEAPIERAPYAPIIGDKRRHMKPGRTYRCRNCGQSLTVAGLKRPTGPTQET